jgi:hypothetical protein
MSCQARTAAIGGDTPRKKKVDRVSPADPICENI